MAAFYLKLGRFAPARDLIAAGVPVALATDVNPGGGFSPSMPFAMTLACFGMGLTFEEALVGRHHQRRVLARSPRPDRQPRTRQTIRRGHDRRARRQSAARERLAHHARLQERNRTSMLASKTVQELLDAFSVADADARRRIGRRAGRRASAHRCSRWWPACRRPRTARRKIARRSTRRMPTLMAAARRAHRTSSIATPPPTTPSSPPIACRKRTDEEKAARKAAVARGHARRDRRAAAKPRAPPPALVEHGAHVAEHGNAEREERRRRGAVAWR